MKRLLYLTVIGITLATPLLASAEVHFSKMTLSEAEKTAIKQKKLVMVDFYTDWCVWCKVLDRKTYLNRSIGQYADAHFVSIKLDAEKEGKDLAKQFDVHAYPTVLFLSPDGKVVNRVLGYQDTSAFERSMTSAVEGGLSGLLEQTKSKTGANDPNAWLMLAEYYAGHDQHSEAISAYDKVLALDPKDQKQYYEQALYGKGFVQDSITQIKTLELASNKYPDRPEARQAFLILMMHEMNSSTPDSAGSRMDRWIAGHLDDADACNLFAWEAAKRNVMLGKAEDYAGRAVNLYQNMVDRANALDTKAEVVAREGRPKDAVIYETQAVMVLKPDENQKQIEEFTARKEQFQKQADAVQGQEPK